MPEGNSRINPLFLQLVLSLQSAAWYQMGKIVSPISGKIEKNLDEAKISIDLVAMLQEKTRGNLLDEEKRILDNALYTLQMNYIDELEREKKEKTAPVSPSDNDRTAPEKSQTAFGPETSSGGVDSSGHGSSGAGPGTPPGSSNAQ